MSAPLFAVSATMGLGVLSVPSRGATNGGAISALAVAVLISATTAGHCLCLLLLPQAYVKAPS
ncbi:hypothetical protein ACFY9H_24915 [Streptomyces bacillaris]|uniref:hypothetical protein n=1 Tax=Streptomyces TaxID=1883 RepID=UPI0020CA7727|nr:MULTISPECIES: hypothetical protein [Streptomyces]